MDHILDKVAQNLSNLIIKKDRELENLFYNLGYEYVREDLTYLTNQWTEKQREVVHRIELLANHNDFKVFWIKLNQKQLPRTSERTIINKITSQFPYNLIIFSNLDDTEWDFVNMKLVKEEEAEENKNPKKRQILRRIRIEEMERLRTATERIAKLTIPVEEVSNLEIQKRHDEAFDVEKVTDAFFEEFQKVFSFLRDNLGVQVDDEEWAHAYALQFINRLMFLYFIQKKRWLGDDSEFVKSYWSTYKQTRQAQDTFVNKWLSILFFEAFNKKFSNPHWLPPKYQEILKQTPFLNGGLFKQNTLDRKHIVNIADTVFEKIFEFLQKYNFTITEDSPIEQEVAVDPEMIGKVYESLVNVSDAGIFYTPRTEITLMCRLALVDRLVNEFGNEYRVIFYRLLFSFLDEDKEVADQAISDHNLWKDIDHFIRNLDIVDPAVGSGSFLVGMLNILTDLTKRANGQLGMHERDYDIKKRIIGRSLYGVDVMDWAVHVCELRLWLQLVVETELKPEQLTLEPLLPNFTFNIRHGDSLVQEVGGVNLTHLKLSGLSTQIKGKITQLKAEKLKYYNNEENCKFKTETAIFQEEIRVFKEILDEQIDKCKERLIIIDKTIQEEGTQSSLFGEEEPKQENLMKQSYEREKEEINRELAGISEAHLTLKEKTDIPFVWNISFAEIFAGEKEGFDIVVGNPPYVRQELIANPFENKEDYSEEEWRKRKKTYKEKLMQSVYCTFPNFFYFNEATKKAKRKMDAKSDLYIYFYIHGLSLLNDKGIFCFVTSNSWLDVGYGNDLREFLLRRVPIHMIIDNQVKRTFKSADINTVICLFGSPRIKKQDYEDSLNPKFVMFCVSFDHVLDSIIFEEIEDVRERTTRQEYRVMPKSVEELLDAGTDKSKLGRLDAYIGDKWGGKYLRAPDIYYTILEKGKDKIVRLGDIAEVRFGIKTGANEFFYLSQEKIDEWGIEEEFLRHVIISPRDCDSIFVNNGSKLKKVFVCSKEKEDLKRTNALNYIDWGEKRKFHQRPSCQGRRRWYEFPSREWAKILWPMIHNDRLNVFWNNHNIAVDHNLFEIHTGNPDDIWASLSCSWQFLFRELYGRSNLGEGALKTEGIDIKELIVLKPEYLSSKTDIIIKSRELFAKRISKSVFEEIKLLDRKTLDDIVFDVIGLTNDERKEVYKAACELVQKRLEKARSV